MNDSPRSVWAPFWIELSIEGEPRVGTLIPKEAFDALLAVAKAADDFRGSCFEDFGGATRLLDEALKAMAAHPGWREWS